MQPLQLEDIQGIVAYAFRRRRWTRYALLELRQGQAQAARRFIGQLSALVRPATFVELPERQQLEARQSAPVLALSFTYPGLQALGLPDSALSSFIPEFRQGMTHPHRSRVLGDHNVGDWDWGGADNLPHVLLAAYHKSNDALQAWFEQTFTEDAPFVISYTASAVLDDPFFEPFGFRDGISQPEVPGLRAPAPTDTGSPHNVVAAGEFLLGYRDLVGHLPASPMVRDEQDPGRCLPALPGGRRDFGRNGSFLVAREIEQHTQAFAELSDYDAAKLMGRWRSGAPLVLAPERDDPSLATANDFGYYNDDRVGLKCPLGAHVRRSNARDSLTGSVRGATPGDAIAAANRHRILRRGRRLEGARSGLFFICFNANIERQFEFIQQGWLLNGGFAGLNGEVDFTAGRPTTLTITKHVKPERLSLDAYTTVRGGGYFFLPGLRALRYLSTLGARAD